MNKNSEFKLIYKITLEVDFCFFCELNEKNWRNVERDILLQGKKPS